MIGHIIQEDVTWIEAQERCASAGTTLARPTNPERFNELIAMTPADGLWIGASSAPMSLAYWWVDGALVDREEPWATTVTTTAGAYPDCKCLPGAYSHDYTAGLAYAKYDVWRFVGDLFVDILIIFVGFLGLVGRKLPGDLAPT